MPRNAKKSEDGGGRGAALRRMLEEDAKGKDGAQTQLHADWRLIDPTTAWRTVLAVTNVGGAIMMGTDSTGFGYTVNIYMQKAKVSKWFRPDDDGITALHTYLEAVEAACLEEL